MSESAKIILVGKSKSVLLKEIEGIRAWDNGKDYPIGVAIDNGFVFDSIDNVEGAIKNNLSEYIEQHFLMINKVLKTGGNDDLYLVDDPNIIGKGKFKKIRNKRTNFTPKKKKRK